MISRITRLELPVGDQVAGFDTTIGDETNTFTMSSSLAAIAVGRSLRTSIATHALAHEQSVCGLSADSSGWTWKTSLAPHRVCQVASNASGTLIAATLDNGTLSILRGSDGTVLATRRVAPEGTRLAASVEFVQHHASAPSSGDTLIILPPDEGPPILVSNMQGERLNTVENPGIVSEAARSMGLHALKLPDCEDIRTMRGISMTEDIIRLAIVDGDGRLAVYDYNLKERKPLIVQRDVNLSNGAEETSWEIDLEVGLRVQGVAMSESMSSTFLLLTLYNGNCSKVCWLNLNELTVACAYVIPSPLTKTVKAKRVRILAMEPVHSCAEKKALALVLGVKYPSNQRPLLETRIIQAVVNDVMGKIVLEKPHLVYTIPVPSSIQSMSVARVAPDWPYSFLCKSWSGDKHDCYLFQTTDSSAISVGTIRLMCAQGKFQEAQELLIRTQDESIVQDPFAHFHSSEITVQRLEHILDMGSLSSPDAMVIAQHCLQQLVQGANSGNSLAKKAFLCVADRILHWPDDKALHNPPFLQEVVAVLEGMIAAMSGVASAVDDGSSDQFSIIDSALNERLLVVRYIYEVLHTTASSPTSSRMSKTFQDVKTFKDLFATLVRHGDFDAAENLSRSNLRAKLTAETMASSILSISTSANPRQFSSLLVEVIFPNLSIGHELLPPILAWACQMADAYDVDGTDNENTLDDAIFLLECAERATKDLRLRLHSSFASYTPFVEKPPKRRKYEPSHSNSSMNSAEMSFASIESGNAVRAEVHLPSSYEIESQRPNPTILEIGRLKGGARKARLDGQMTSTDAVDENEDSVEMKLSSARCLKYARALGLESHSVTLGTFAEAGGAQNIAKELVKKFSKSSSSSEQRTHSLCENVGRFCERTVADFDEALFSYVRDLCGGKTATRSNIEEAASIARCCRSAGIKCQVTLIALRAALFCRFSPKWLSELSLEAIEWAAGDSSLRSELEEASRLLLIDGIVGRYCGEGAKELFHVDNPRHAIRLLQFVARKFDNDETLADSLALCDAFAHLSREDACSHILENAILKGNQASAPGRLSALYAQNVMLARATFSRVIPFCIDLIDEAAKQDIEASKNERFAQLVQCGQDLATVALSNFHSRANNDNVGFSAVHYDERSLEDLVLDFKRLASLQKDHFVCLTISSLREPKSLVKAIAKMLIPVTNAYLVGDATSSGAVVTKMKRACGILSGCCYLESSDLWHAAVGSSSCHLAMKSKDLECFNFMADLGIFDATQSFLAARTFLAVSLTFCLKASKLAATPEAVGSAMKHVAMALSLLRDHALLQCPLDFVDPTVSVAELCDVISQVFSRSDEGIGEELDIFQKSLCAAKPSSSTDQIRTTRIHRPVLHPTWYIGDGLLLPPSETLISALKYCKQTLQAPTRSDATLSLHSFVDGRGAYGLGLRLLAVSSVTRMSSIEKEPSYVSLEDAGRRTFVALSERYLGGTSNGFTSGGVDSQMAVSFLLCLPVKTAFSVYKSSLPTAISTRDFPRVVTLANVGAAAGTGKLFPVTGLLVQQQWARQQNFVVQCRELSLRARWWNKLQEFNVTFDTHRFQDLSQSSKEKTKASGTYITSLLPPFICNLSRKISDPEIILGTILDFSGAFGLPRDVAVRKYVEFLLSPPETEPLGISMKSDDIRMKLGCLGKIVQSLLKNLNSQCDRAVILRTCLRRLEEPATSLDYERLSVVLSLYHAELSGILSKVQHDGVQNCQSFELELIDRRRDTLAILSWFFQNERYEDRPAFSDLFLPLPESWDADYSKKTGRFANGVLGKDHGSDKDYSFDPLRALDKVLSSSKGIVAASALAPLCLPLGVPRGYIHVRCLMSRFKKSVQAGAALPSFEDDVLPTLNRLQLSDDVADLAEWCALQYRYEDTDKLRCLDHALTFAMKASTESEASQSRMSGKDIIPEEALSVALERVKRITEAKDMLADRLSLNAILKSANSGMEVQNGFGDMVTALIGTLDEKIWAKEVDFVPERFVEIFIEESSRIASEGCLNRGKAVSVGQVRSFSKLVNRAAAVLAEKYSHVQIHGIARRLIRRWLLHGDNSTCDEQNPLDSGLDTAVSERTAKNILHDIDEDDTMNFVMDLNALQQANDFSAASTHHEAKLTSEEEPKVFTKEGSSRENNDWASRRVSLRVAFVMAFVGEDSALDNGHVDAENQEPVKNAKVKPSRLRSKLSVRGSKQSNDSVFDHCRELLRIVFARSVASGGWMVRDQNVSMDSRSVGASFGENGKQTITFAMRHRALRVASILCPQSALENVADEEELLKESQSTLSKSAFAVFVAKEIEEMGLPLPHSDLAQLSTMHFPSYARTLWRHHREGKRPIGRLLLLILDMYLKEEVTDHHFFLSILSEMDRLSLPRTLLLGFECVLLYMDRIGPEPAAAFIDQNGTEIVKLIGSLTIRALRELEPLTDGISSELQSFDFEAVTAILMRLSVILKAFSKYPDGQASLSTFLNALLQLMEQGQLGTSDIMVMVQNLLCHLTSEEQRLELSNRIRVLSKTELSLVRPFAVMETIDEESTDLFPGASP